MGGNYMIIPDIYSESFLQMSKLWKKSYAQLCKPLNESMMTLSKKMVDISMGETDPEAAVGQNSSIPSIQKMKTHRLCSLLDFTSIFNSCNEFFILSTLDSHVTVSYTHLRAHETVLDLVCRLLL